MEQDTLHAIVEVEREIQQRLDAQRRDADERLAALELSCREEEAREEARLKRDLEEAVEKVMAGEGGEPAVALVAAAQAEAGRIEGLDDETLRRILRAELPGILPGARP